MGGARKRHHSSDDEDRDVVESDLEDQEEGGRKDSHRKKSSHEHKKSKKKKKDKKSKKKKRRRRSSVGSVSPTSSSHGRTKAELVAGDDEASTDREGENKVVRLMTKNSPVKWILYNQRVFSIFLNLTDILIPE